MPDKKYNYISKYFSYNGKKYKVYGKNSIEVALKMIELEKDLKAGLHSGALSDKTTVKRWSEDWMDVYIKPKDATAKSIAMYQQKLDNYILPEIGTMKLGDVKDIHLKKILNSANSSFSNSQKVKVVIHAMFHQAYKSRIIQFDPSEDLTLPKAPKGKRRSITESERSAILKTAETHPAGLWILLMLYCGPRDNEIIPLQGIDFDTEEHILHIHKALESGSAKSLKSPKTDAGDRYIPVPDVLWPKIKERIDSLDTPFDIMFIQPQGKKMHTHSSLNDAWNNFKRQLDINMGAKVYRNQIIEHKVAADLTPYCLRHTFGTDLQRAGVPINVAKYLMGHSDIRVTANIYTDTTSDVIFAAAKKVNEFHKKASGGK